MCRLKFVTLFTAMLETRGRRRWSWSADDSWLSYVKGNYPNLVFACCVSSRNMAIRGSGQARLLTEETSQYCKRKTLWLFGFDGKPRKSLCLSVCDICELSTLSKREILRLVNRQLLLAQDIPPVVGLPLPHELQQILNDAIIDNVARKMK